MYNAKIPVSFKSNSYGCKLFISLPLRKESQITFFDKRIDPLSQALLFFIPAHMLSVDKSFSRSSRSVRTSTNTLQAFPGAANPRSPAGLRSRLLSSGQLGQGVWVICIVKVLRIFEKGKFLRLLRSLASSLYSDILHPTTTLSTLYL